MATSDITYAFQNSDLVIIATPTHFNEEKQTFDLSSIDETLQKIIASNRSPLVIIKSTVNVGATRYFMEKYPSLKIFLSLNFYAKVMPFLIIIIQRELLSATIKMTQNTGKLLFKLLISLKNTLNLLMMSRF